MAKNGPFWRVFWKPEACGQTVLPDRSDLIGQKLVENTKIKNANGTFWVIFKQCDTCRHILEHMFLINCCNLWQVQFYNRKFKWNAFGFYFLPNRKWCEKILKRPFAFWWWTLLLHLINISLKLSGTAKRSESRRQRHSVKTSWCSTAKIVWCAAAGAKLAQFLTFIALLLFITFYVDIKDVKILI